MEPDSDSGRWLRRVRSAGVLPVVVVLLLAGCAAADTAPATGDDAPPADSSTDNSSTDESAEAEDSADDGDVVVEGEELVEDSFIVITAETYASGRTPQPRITFTAPLEVTFTYPGTLEATTQIADCAIAFSLLDQLGVGITFVDDSGSFDCSAEYGS